MELKENLVEKPQGSKKVVCLKITSSGFEINNRERKFNPLSKTLFDSTTSTCYSPPAQMDGKQESAVWPPVFQSTPEEPTARPERPEEPRGSWRSWAKFVVFGSFLTNLIIGGMEKSNGIIYLKLTEKFDRSASDTAWVVSFSSTARLLFGPLASLLCNRFSCRHVAIGGSLILAVGLIISSCMAKLEFLYLSFGLIGGLGKSFALTPSVVIVGMYFDKKKGTALGVASAGGGLGTLIIPPLMEVLFTEYSFFGAFIILAAFSLHICISGSLYRPAPVASTTDVLFVGSRKEGKPAKNEDARGSYKVPLMDFKQDVLSTAANGSTSLPKGTHYGHVIHLDAQNAKKATENGHFPDMQLHSPVCEQTAQGKAKRLLTCFCCDTQKLPKECLPEESPKKVYLDLSLLKDPSFLLFSISLCLLSSGSHSSGVFVPALGLEKGLGYIQAAYLLSIVGVTDILSKPLAGAILDFKPVRPYRLIIYNVNMFFIALIIILCPFMETFVDFGILCGAYGILNGIIGSQKAVMLTELLGSERLPSSFGLAICFQGFGALSGPPLSGLLKDLYNTYNEPFYFIAATVLAGAVIMACGNVLHTHRTNNARLAARDTDDCSTV